MTGMWVGKEEKSEDVVVPQKRWVRGFQGKGSKQNHMQLNSPRE